MLHLRESSGFLHFEKIITLHQVTVSRIKRRVGLLSSLRKNTEFTFGDLHCEFKYSLDYSSNKLHIKGELMNISEKE